MAALAQLVETIGKFGELETALQMNNLQGFDFQQEEKENVEKADAKRTAMANEFVAKIMSGQGNMMDNQPQGQEASMQQAM